MKEIRILNLESRGYSPKARAILEEFAFVRDGPLERKEMLLRVEEFDALIVRLGHVIDGEVLNRAKRLKVIASATTGLNHIDTKAAARRNIAILSLQGEIEFLQEVHATAEYTWALLLALMRNIPTASFHVREGRWDRDLFRGKELHDKTLGIIGFGRIGSKVARYGIAFGMEVLAHDKKKHAQPGGVNVVSLEELLRRSDVISVHVSYEEATHHLIAEQAFTQMKKGVILINTSRGEVVDQKSLLSALGSGKVAGAALDVLEGEYERKKEWVKRHPLVRYAQHNPDLLITPHIGGATAESMEKTEVFIAQKLRSFFYAF